MTATPAQDFKVRYHVPTWITGEPKIFKAMIDVQRKLDGITKDRRNKDQNFNFRGIDDVYNMLHPLLAEAGLITPPSVLERIDGERGMKNGGTMLHVKLLVEYTFIAEDGSQQIVGPVWGEALDTSDKSSNKALAFAQKYIMLQTFTIPTEDTRETLEEREGDLRSVETNGPAQGHGQSGPPPPAYVVMLQKFSEVGIGRSHLEKKWAKRVEDFGDKELEAAREVFGDICKNPHTRSTHFEGPFGGQQQPAQPPPQQRPQANAGSRLNARGAAR